MTIAFSTNSDDRVEDWAENAPQAVLFDCYGTLLRIADQRHPYVRLAKLAGGRLDPSPMTSPLSLRDVAARNGVPIRIDEARLGALESDLAMEIASTTPIVGALDLLVRLRSRGFRLAVVSNVALPYAEPIRRWLGSLVDAQVLSFEVGTAKPAPAIYHEACDRLGVQPERALMAGDSMANDYRGAIAAGLRARVIQSGSSVAVVLREMFRLE